MSVTLNREHRAKLLRVRTTTSAVGGGAVVPHAAAPHPVHGAPVFSINFIRHHSLPVAVRRVLLYTAIGYVVASVIVLAVLLGMGVSSGTQWRALQHHVQQATPSRSGRSAAVREEMDVLRQQAAQNVAELHAAIERRQRQFPVGGKLAGLTRTLPARTWLTNVTGEQKDRKMTIQAAYLVDPERPYDLPTKGWMAALKADPAFGQGLKSLELTSSTRKNHGRAELFIFQLSAAW